MACTPPVRTIILAKNVPVWSTGGSNPGESDVFVLSPDALVQLAPLISQIRATMTVSNATTALLTRPVFQPTDDGCTWDTAINLDTNKQGNGTWTSSWYSTVGNFKRGLRVGIIASQDTGSSTIEQGRVTLVLDVQLKS